MSDDCLFCRIVSGDVPADVIARNDQAVAFRDISPVAPTHVLVIPRSHHANLAEIAAADGIEDDGYRLVANTGAAAHQTVFHAHLHLVGGRSMGWPPG